MPPIPPFPRMDVGRDLRLPSTFDVGRTPVLDQALLQLGRSTGRMPSGPWATPRLHIPTETRIPATAPSIPAPAARPALPRSPGAGLPAPAPAPAEAPRLGDPDAWRFHVDPVFPTTPPAPALR